MSERMLLENLVIKGVGPSDEDPCFAGCAQHPGGSQPSWKTVTGSFCLSPLPTHVKSWCALPGLWGWRCTSLAECRPDCCVCVADVTEELQEGGQPILCLGLEEMPGL